MTKTDELARPKLRMLVLERRDATRNMARFYVLAIEPTLFGDTALIREWGRIGSAGRRRLDRTWIRKWRQKHWTSGWQEAAPRINSELERHFWSFLGNLTLAVRRDSKPSRSTPSTKAAPEFRLALAPFRPLAVAMLTGSRGRIFGIRAGEWPFGGCAASGPYAISQVARAARSVGLNRRR